MTRHLILSAPLLLLTAAAPAYAELVFFQSGRAMSVRAIRSENDGIVLQLRAGGDVHCDQSLIVRVEPDEVEYPDEVAEASSVSGERGQCAGRWLILRPT